ncbi:unnamed protein product, partial [Iphiclides podalirius]
MAAPAHEHYRRDAELRPQHSRDSSRDSGIFHTTKGLWNAPGLNNCFLNSAVQRKNFPGIRAERSATGVNYGHAPGMREILEACDGTGHSLDVTKRLRILALDGLLRFNAR